MWERLFQFIEEMFFGNLATKQNPMFSVISPNPSLEPVAPLTSAEKLYVVAKGRLDTHITLDESVPGSLGCAESVSFCLSRVDKLLVPPNGLQGTLALYHWMSNHPEKFVRVTQPTAGTIIISPTGMNTNNPTSHGHVGICGNEGIMSNESASGLFKEQWTLEAWASYYVKALGFPVFYFNLA